MLCPYCKDALVKSPGTYKLDASRLMCPTCAGKSFMLDWRGGILSVEWWVGSETGPIRHQQYFKDGQALSKDNPLISGR
jgi:hypothetical protein